MGKSSAKFSLIKASYFEMSRKVRMLFEHVVELREIGNVQRTQAK